MGTAFFANPLWRKFAARSIWIVSLSESEHRLRDARALIALRDFLPPAISGRSTYATITLDSNSRPITRWPRIPADAGIVVLGRPALFGPEFKCHFESVWTPTLDFSFVSDDLLNEGYRTIEASGTGQRFCCPSFAEQRRAEPSPDELYDYGIVYSGWAHDHPVMLLAGSSTVGTWGCVKFATEQPKPFDTRWQEDVQGVVKASVSNSVECFQEIRADPVEVLAPCRVWMEGRDLPCSGDWGNPARLRLQEKKTDTKFDLQILINDRPIFQRSRTHIPALVLLALVGARVDRRAFSGGAESHAEVNDILHALFDFLHLGRMNGEQHQKSFEDFALDHRNHVNGVLKDLVRQVRDSGGIASVRDTERTTYGICTRDLPPFLPAISS